MNLCGKLRIDKFDFFGSNSIMARNNIKFVIQVNFSTITF